MGPALLLKGRDSLFHLLLSQQHLELCDCVRQVEGTSCMAAWWLPHPHPGWPHPLLLPLRMEFYSVGFSVSDSIKLNEFLYCLSIFSVLI